MHVKMWIISSLFSVGIVPTPNPPALPYICPYSYSHPAHFKPQPLSKISDDTISAIL